MKKKPLTNQDLRTVLSDPDQLQYTLFHCLGFTTLQLNIDIQGRIKNRNLACFYAHIVAKALKIHRLKRDITIQFVTRCEGDVLGYCWGDKDEAFIEIARNEGDRKISFLELMQTMTHEMVHAKQYFRKELFFVENDRYWKGDFADDLGYMEQPWEIEAYALEKQIFSDHFPFQLEFTN